MVRHRTITVSEDVYGRLSRLTVERNKSMSDLIRELLDNYEGGVDSGVIERLGRIETMLRDCLDKLGVRELGRVVEAGNVKTTPTEVKNESGGNSLFGDNPWVQILRVRYGSQDS